MAWLDDRIWAHPKTADLTPVAFRSFVFAIAYSSGFGLYGHLTDAHLRKLDVTASSKRELIRAGLWHEKSVGGIEINDWAEHNGKRDDALETRRQADRERKRREREKKSQTVTGQSRDSSVTESRDSPRDVHRDAPRAPACARTGAPPMTSDRVTEEPSSSTSTTDVQPDDELRLRLDTLGLKGRAAAAAAELLTSDPARLDACITTALKRGTDATPYLAELVLNGSHPEPPAAPQPTLAPGATGSRSTADPRAQTCPHCSVVIRPPTTLADHIERQHTEHEAAPPPAAALALAGRTTSSSEPPAPPKANP